MGILPVKEPEPEPEKSSVGGLSIQEQMQTHQLQIQTQGEDIEQLKIRVKKVLQGQEDMKQGQEEMRRAMAKLLERSEVFSGTGRKNSETPPSGLNTPPGQPMNRNKRIEGTGTSGSGQGGGTGGGNGGTGWVFGTREQYESGRGRYDYRTRKIDMPLFDGTDPDGWILHAERYFAIY